MINLTPYRAYTRLSSILHIKSAAYVWHSLSKQEWFWFELNFSLSSFSTLITGRTVSDVCGANSLMLLGVSACRYLMRRQHASIPQAGAINCLDTSSVRARIPVPHAKCACITLCVRKKRHSIIQN